VLRAANLRAWTFVAFGLAVAVRWAVTLRYYRDLPLGLTDNFYYHEQANLIADGEGFLNPFALLVGERAQTAAHPPLYSIYLALWSLVGADSALWHRLASGLVSAAAVIPVALVANRLAGHRAAIAAGFGVALYPPLWMNDGLILSESLYVTLAALTIWQAHRVIDDPTRRRVLELTVILAAGALTRSESVLLFGVLLVPIVLRSKPVSLPDRFRLLTVAAAVAAVLLAPWVVRNLVTFDEPTFLAVGPGYVLELGNCDQTYSGPFLGYWSVSCDQSDWADGDESAIGARKLEIARDYIADHLGEQPKVVSARVGRLFGLFRPFQTADFDVLFERRIDRHVRLGLWAHWAASIVAVAGTAVLWSRRESVLPTLTMIGLAAWTAAVTFGITRYRVGADVAIIVLAAVAVGCLADRLRSAPHPTGSTSGDLVPAP
jgi:hypothetical protein